METVLWDELITAEQWDNEIRSDIEFDKSRVELSKDARKRCRQRNPMNPHPDIGLLVPSMEASLTIKLARKNPKSKRSKKNLDGLYDVLAPGS